MPIQTESWKAAFREIIPADILSEYTDSEPVTRMYEHLLTHGIAHGYILERDGAPHGIAWWDAAREPDMSGTAELICIHSLPAHWHQGYGKLLLEKVLRDVKRRIPLHPALGIRCQSAAIRFYRSSASPPAAESVPPSVPWRRCIQAL
ncbi:MAG: GNAT family N-acetyltransferase [Oscillospiraceae bacterium]